MRYKGLLTKKAAQLYSILARNFYYIANYKHFSKSQSLRRRLRAKIYLIYTNAIS